MILDGKKVFKEAAINFNEMHILRLRVEHAGDAFGISL